jgi:hypothetical protein
MHASTILLVLQIFSFERKIHIEVHRVTVSFIHIRSLSISDFLLSVYFHVIRSHVFQVPQIVTQRYDLRECVETKHYCGNDERTA